MTTGNETRETMSWSFGNFVTGDNPGSLDQAYSYLESAPGLNNDLSATDIQVASGPNMGPAKGQGQGL